MEQSDRDKIQGNIVTLSNSINLKELTPVLIRRGVIDQEFVERVKVYKTPREQTQEFFLRYTRRGPDAFEILLQSLRDAGYSKEAQLLENKERRSRLASLESPSESSNSSSISNGSHRNPFESPASSSSSPLLSSKSGHSASSNEPKEETSPFSPRIVAIAPQGFSPARPFNELNISNDATILRYVKNATRYNQGNIEDAYPMMSRPRGFALIVNNIIFQNDPESTRTGAEIDSDNLRVLLNDLGFEVTVKHNVTRNELLNSSSGILKKFISKFSVKDVNCCVVAIMSHGLENYIRCSDPGETYVRVNEDIISRFNNMYCPVLIKKPKIFIIQACRGDNRDKGVRVTRSDGKKIVAESTSFVQEDPVLDADQNDLNLYPTNGDIMICYSTVPGFVANRDIERGTWYIQCFCEAFSEHAHDTEIHGLLRKVGQKMGMINSEYDEKQMSSFKNIGFNLELYFNPGLYATETEDPGSNTGETATSV